MLELLKQLDDKVEVLLKRLRQLQDEKEQLMKHLADRELRFGEASARLRECEEFRDGIKTGIEIILVRLDSLNLV
jgi:chromosome segregation ATPase